MGTFEIYVGKMDEIMRKHYLFIKMGILMLRHFTGSVLNLVCPGAPRDIFRSDLHSILQDL